MKALVSVLAIAALLAGATRPAIAHHSFAAEYDDQKPLKITGTRRPARTAATSTRLS